MSGSRLSSVLRSSVSPSAGDRNRLYSTTPSVNGFFKKLLYGDGDTHAAQTEVKTEESKATDTVAVSNKSANSTAAPALRPSATAAAATPAVRTPSVAPSTSRRPTGASSSSAAPSKSTISGLQQRQQQQQWRPAIATRAAAAQQNTRFERPVGGSSIARQTITPPATSSSAASRGASPAFNGARSLPTPTSRAAAAAPLRVAVQRARIDASFNAVVEKAEKEEAEVAKDGATVASREVDNEVEAVETLISEQASEDGGSFEEGEVAAQNFGVENKEVLDCGSNKLEAMEVKDTIEDTGSQGKQNVSQNNDNADTGSIQDNSLETGSAKDVEASSVMQKIRSFFKR